MEKLEPYATALGRVLLSMIFIFSGFEKIFNLGNTIQYMAAHNVPWPEYFVFLSIVVEIIGGLFVFLGYRAGMGAGMLMFIIVPATFYFHHFWSYDGVARSTHTQMFLKNLAIFGGLLYVFTHGPGLCNLEDELKRRREQAGPPGGGPMGPGGPGGPPPGVQMGPGGPQMGGPPQAGQQPGAPPMSPGGPPMGPPPGGSGPQTPPPGGPPQARPPGG